jgi:hypothetical protein
LQQRFDGKNAHLTLTAQLKDLAGDPENKKGLLEHAVTFSEGHCRFMQHAKKRVTRSQPLT